MSARGSTVSLLEEMPKRLCVSSYERLSVSPYERSSVSPYEPADVSTMQHLYPPVNTLHISK